tara:strand:- start:1214 stop:1585 length:372 start_codon:yes stop_codon:yes gene_type:complete
MPAITITFGVPLNVSCQVGDTAYFVETSSDGGFNINNNQVTEIGQIRQITPFNGTQSSIVCHNNDTLPGSFSNSPAKFILFSKDNKANMSSVLGYHATVKFTNNSMSEAELFSVGLEAVESSK